MTDIPLGEVCAGLTIRRTSKDYIAVRLEHFADPAKRGTWLEEQRRRYPDEASFRRECLLDWEAAGTEVLYPEFSTHRDTIVRRSDGLIAGPIYRSWDTGGRNPAVAWAQFEPGRQVVWMLRELSPKNIGAHALRDLAMFLSGQIPEQDLPPRALDEVARIREDARYPKPPWFPPGCQFIDFAGHEIRQGSSLVPEESPEHTFQEVLAAKNVYITMWKGDVSDRVGALRYLMIPRRDGTFGFYVDPACPVLIEGLASGIRWQRGTPMNPHPNKVFKDGVYEHIHDALGYMLVNLVQVRDEPPAEPDRPVTIYRPSVDPGRGDYDGIFHEGYTDRW